MRKKERHLKYSHIVPTSEEMELLPIAINTHIKRAGKYIDREELLGDAYEGLLIGLHSYTPDKCINSNKEGYLVSKIKFHLIDCFRSGHKLRNKYQIDVTSLDLPINDGEDTLSSIIPDCSKSMEDTFYEEELLNFVEESFSKMKRIRKNDLSGDDLFTLLMLRIENHTYRQLASLTNITEGRICQLFSTIIMPKLEKIHKELSVAL